MDWLADDADGRRQLVWARSAVPPVAGIGQLLELVSVWESQT
jgi:hypothetical protein